MRRDRASSVCVHADRLLTVQLRDPVTQVARLFVPGGGIEAHESPAQAAIRETLEETGYHVRLLDQPAPVVRRYPFTWMEQHYDVTTHFFAAALITPYTHPAPVFDASYLEGTFWLPLEQVQQALGFDADILGAVLQVMPRS